MKSRKVSRGCGCPVLRDELAKRPFPGRTSFIDLTFII
jgi:hypothetical protein